MHRWTYWLRTALALAMIAIGLAHFIVPQPFVTIVPKPLPAPLLLVMVSGFFEVAGGVGLLIPKLRRAAAWGLVLLYLAVFPANINMAIHPADAATGIPVWALWARLPLQFVLIWLVLRVTRVENAAGSLRSRTAARID